MHELMSFQLYLCQGLFMEIFSTTSSLKLQLFIFSFKIPSLTGEMLILLYPRNRDGERKPKRGR